MICIICESKIDRLDPTKIACGDCKRIFHSKCVNLKEQDLQYYKSSGNQFRCDKCATIRRNSLHQSSTVVVNKAKEKTAMSTGSAAPTTRLPTTSTGVKAKTTAPTGKPNTIQMEQQVESVVITQLESTTDRHKNNSSASQSLSNTITLQHLYEEIISLKKVNIEVLNGMKILQEENNGLKHKITVLESKMNWLEQNKKQNMIEITGISNVDNNNALDLAKKVFCECMNVSIDSDDIDKCYFKKIMYKSHNNSALKSRKTICVNFTSNEKKLKILKCKSTEEVKKKLNTSTFGDKDRNVIYVNHSFTKYTQALFMAAKEVKKNQHYKYLWFSNSNILLRKEENSKAIVIRSFSDLEKI